MRRPAFPSLALFGLPGFALAARPAASVAVPAGARVVDLGDENGAATAVATR